MDSYRLYTIAVIIVLMLSIYIQIKLLNMKKGFGYIIPASMVLIVFMIWAGNEFQAIKCLPVTIILLFFCLVNLFVVFIKKRC